MTAPASSFDMSSSSLKSTSSASTDVLMLATRPLTPGSRARSDSAAAISPSACSGWRRSWFAAAKNCVRDRFAASAWARAASAISFCRESASISSTFSNRRRIASSTSRFTLRPNISAITSAMPSGIASAISCLLPEARQRTMNGPSTSTTSG